MSSIFDHYRVSARAVWNNAFWPIIDHTNWNYVDQFDEIKRILFDQLVLDRVGKDFPVQNIFRTPMAFFRVVPSWKSSPVMIQNPRPDKSTGYWDHPVNRLGPEDAEMHFLEYFDWNRLDFVDFEYYHAMIARFDTRPELVGREVLIDRKNASVQMVEDNDVDTTTKE